MCTIVFDTETTGLPTTKIINPDTLHLFPHIVQFSFVKFDNDKNDITESFDFIVKVDDNVNIPEESTKIHGITSEMSMTKGLELKYVIKEFFNHFHTDDLIVGHNISFDLNILHVEMLRLIYSDKLSEEELIDFKYKLHLLTTYKNIYCTMKESIKRCNISVLNKYGRTELKWPKLYELHQVLFDNSTPKNLHNSYNDILITLRCFMKLKYDNDLILKSLFHDS